MKKTNSKIRPVEGFIEHLWRWSPLVILLVAVGLICGSCGVIKPVPVETNTEVHYIDSVRYEIRDSIRIIEATRYKDMAWLGDSLKIQGSRSRCWAVADTARGAIVGGLEEDRVEEKTKVIYRDRIQYRDSLVYQDRPVPYEVEKKVIPKWTYYSLIGNIILLLLIGLGIYLKMRR